MQERTLGDFSAQNLIFQFGLKRMELVAEVVDFVKMIKWVEAERKGTERFEMGKMTKI